MMGLNEQLEVAAGELCSAAASLPARSWGQPPRTRGARVAMTVAGVAAVAALVVAPLVWLAGGRGESPGPGPTGTTVPEPSTSSVSSTTQLPTATSEPEFDWNSLGEPVSDDEFPALFPGTPHEPGTVRRLAWTTFRGYRLGFFANQEVRPEVGQEQLFCLRAYAADEEGRRFGGDSRCSSELQGFIDMLAFGAAWTRWNWTETTAGMSVVWGVPESADSVVFVVSDGTRLVGQTVNGVAMVAWGGDLAVRSITFDGETAAQAEIIWPCAVAASSWCGG